MRLYVNPISPFCRAAAITLGEKSVPFETVPLVRGGDRARLLRLSPTGEVPLLETRGRVIAGCAAICEFAEHEHPLPALLPAGLVERADCRRIEAVAHSTTDAFQFLVHLLHFRRPELGEARPAAVALLDQAVAQHYAFLEATLGGANHLVGAYSRADIACFSMVSSLVSMDRPIPASHDSLAAWLTRVGSRPVVTRSSAEALRSEAEQLAGEDPFFRADRIHWRSHRVEWACRIGLADWLAEEIDAGRAFFSPPPGSVGSV